MMVSLMTFPTLVYLTLLIVIPLISFPVPPSLLPASLNITYLYVHASAGLHACARVRKGRILPLSFSTFPSQDSHSSGAACWPADICLSPLFQHWDIRYNTQL